MAKLIMKVMNVFVCLPVTRHQVTRHQEWLGPLGLNCCFGTLAQARFGLVLSVFLVGDIYKRFPILAFLTKKNNRHRKIILNFLASMWPRHERGLLSAQLVNFRGSLFLAVLLQITRLSFLHFSFKC